MISAFDFTFQNFCLGRTKVGTKQNHTRYRVISAFDFTFQNFCLGRTKVGTKQNHTRYRSLFCFYFREVIRRPGLRRDTITLFEYFFGDLVFCPLPTGRPCFVRARRCPRGAFPSPPPCG